MKFIAVILFSFLLLTQTFSKWLLVMDYAINKEYIAKTLCENKARPQMHCNGKCQLMKKLAAEENQSSKSSSGHSSLKTVFSEVWFSDELPSFGLNFASFKTSFSSFYLIKKYSSLRYSVFHPPLV